MSFCCVDLSPPHKRRTNDSPCFKKYTLYPGPVLILISNKPEPIGLTSPRFPNESRSSRIKIRARLRLSLRSRSHRSNSHVLSTFNICRLYLTNSMQVHVSHEQLYPAANSKQRLSHTANSHCKFTLQIHSLTYSLICSVTRTVARGIGRSRIHLW